jgi:serine protease Do
MNACSKGALAAVLAVAAGLGPGGSAVKGQSRDSRDTLVRLADIGRGSRIGITVEDLEESDNKQAGSGVVVGTVDSGGPADKAGMKAGDVITEFDGDRVRTVRQFQRLVQEAAPGRSVPVAVARGGQRVTLNVTPDASSIGDGFGMRYLDVPGLPRPAIPAPPSPPSAPRPPRSPLPAAPPAFDNFFSGDGPFLMVTGRSRLGITSEALSSQLADYFGVKDGALVKSVQDGSAAAKAGIKAGDVITSINGSRVYDPSDISRAITRMDDGAEFTVDVVRDHKTQTLKGKVESSSVRRRNRTATSEPDGNPRTSEPDGNPRTSEPDGNPEPQNRTATQNLRTGRQPQNLGTVEP